MASESDVWLDHRFGSFGTVLGAGKGFGTMLGAFGERFEWLQWLEMSFGALRVTLAPCWALSKKGLNGFRKA